jgi:hypothetical protein
MLSASLPSQQNMIVEEALGTRMFDGEVFSPITIQAALFSKN